MRTHLAIVGFFLLIGAFAGGFFAHDNLVKYFFLDASVPATVTNTTSGKPDAVDFTLFWQVWNLLNKEHIRKPFDAQTLVFGAIKGMVEAAGDRFTAFMDPEETKSFQEQLGGSFEGIGAELTTKDGFISIIAPIKGSPAEKAGILAGDYITKIDGVSTEGMSLTDAVGKIRGTKGTSVTLTIARKDADEREVKITRDVIEVASVETSYDGTIATITISTFGQNTTTEFRKAVNDVVAHGSKGIIVDLRSNPGGILDSAVDISSEFLQSNSLVVTERYASGKEQAHRSRSTGKFAAIPTVVLVDGGSASASEIMAGALRDDRHIKLIGEKTFGKGSVQEYQSLPMKTSIRITFAEWLTPAGNQITGKGLEPDIKVERTFDDIKANKDPQMDKAKEEIKKLIQ